MLPPVAACCCILLQPISSTFIYTPTLCLLYLTFAACAVVTARVASFCCFFQCVTITYLLHTHIRTPCVSPACPFGLLLPGCNSALYSILQRVAVYYCNQSFAKLYPHLLSVSFLKCELVLTAHFTAFCSVLRCAATTHQLNNVHEYIHLCKYVHI